MGKKVIELAPYTDNEIEEKFINLETNFRYQRENYPEKTLNMISHELNVPRTTMRDRLKRLEDLRTLYPDDDRLENPENLPGTTEPKEAIKKDLPTENNVKRYILTSAQNNTKVHDKFFNNLIAYADVIDAELMVGTYTYSHNNNSEFTVKKGSNKEQSSLWWAGVLEPYITDERIQLTPDLVWCGDWNILPTAADPVTSLDSYNGISSNIFPHAKLRQKSIGVQKGERVKRNITTGTVTKLNYVQRKAGQKAEFDHVFGAIIVEVDSTGFWLHRQIMANSVDGSFYDLNHYVDNEKVLKGIPDIAVIHGDIHAAKFDETLFEVLWSGVNSVKSLLNPQLDVLHDLLDFESQNYHDRDIFSKYEKYVKGKSSVQTEMNYTAFLLGQISKYAKNVKIPYSNHDDMLRRWLQDYNNDFRNDLENAIYYLELMREQLIQIHNGNINFSIWEWAIRNELENDVNNVEFFTDVDITQKYQGVEIAKHGHIGSKGGRGSLKHYSNSGQKTVVGHYHSAEIDRGAFSVGVYSKMWPSYAKGLNNWTHTFCIIYPNGKRTLVDIMKNNQDEWKWFL